MEQQTLVIRHLQALQFSVQRWPDGKTSTAVPLAAPDEITVEGRPGSNLLLDLRWYLERFLDYPFEPYTAVAERVQEALGNWGRSAFKQLFADQALLWYDRARQGELKNLVLKIASDDPRVLAWPWEALCDPDGTTLAQSCRLERQLSRPRDPLPLPAELPESTVNILLVIARPYGDEDVGFHAVSGPLVDWVRESGLGVHIDVLRPPTFEALRQRLAARRGQYHIVHFDGHGGYGEPGGPAAHTLGGREGHLLFEDTHGAADLVTARKLTELLTEHRIPVMVLNACQSARIEAGAQDPFASTAAALLRAGIRSVVAMGYTLYVSAAQQFVPGFYRRLFESGNVAEAMRAGRQAMLARDARQSLRGAYPLRDWLVPVLYQQDSVPLPVQLQRREAAPALPEAAAQLGDYGFIGRQDAIQRLERALLRQPAAAILIHGMAGIGKTTLAKGFLRWLQHTNGLPGGSGEGADAAFAAVRWFPFDEIQTAEHVINRLVESCFGANAMAHPLQDKLAALIPRLLEQPLLMVWDNFESAAGIAGSEVTPLLSESDRGMLKGLLKALRGGRSKVLITSRSSEHWLSVTEAFRLPLAGLRGEDAWTYCNAVVGDLGLQFPREDPHILALIQELEGHPLALRSVLLRLAEVPAPRLLEELRRAFAGQTGDESTRRIFAALSLLDRGLPASFAPVLALVGLHQRYVDLDHVAGMMGIAGTDARREVLVACFAALERGGLLHPEGQGIYSMHPALPGYLASAHAAPESAVQQFVAFMAAYADQIAPKELHEQRGHFALHGANFQRALALATQCSQVEPAFGLTQAQGAFALHSRDFATAARLYETLVVLASDQPASQAVVYHQLGMIAEEQRDFAAAERWYLKSLAIKEKQGNEHGAASTYHQLGIIAQEQRDVAAAERWYLKSLAIEEKQGNEHGAAITYGQLGRLSLARAEHLAAGEWFLKAQQGFAGQQAPQYREMALRDLAETLQSAPAPVQRLLRERCEAVGLGRDLADLQASDTPESHSGGPLSTVQGSSSTSVPRQSA